MSDHPVSGITCQTDNSNSDKICQPAEPWDTIIVNQIPVNVDEEKLVSLFSQYGKIENTYLCKAMKWAETKHERTARITFCNEDDAQKVLEASQTQKIKYDDQVLMITLASDNYSPIQNLPDTCLREIFCRVHAIEDKFRVEMVCKRWKDNGRCCWSNITKIRSFGWRVNTWKVILSRVANSVEDLRFYVDEEVAGGILGTVVEHCVHLKSLECEFINMDYAPRAPQLETIIQKNRNLHRIQFWTYVSVENVDINFMGVLPAELVELDIQVFDRHSIPATVALSKFQSLRVLTFHRVTIIDHRAVDDVVNLERLSLIDCEIPETILSRILGNNKGLKYLDIGMNGLSDASLMYLQRLPELQVLVIQSDEFSDAYLGEMPGLKGLACCACPLITDEGMRNFFNSASDIMEVCIQDCPIISQSVIIAREYTERTGKSLKLFVDEILFDQYSRSRERNTENFEVIEFGEGIHPTWAKGWGLNLLD